MKLLSKFLLFGFILFLFSSLVSAVPQAIYPSNNPLGAFAVYLMNQTSGDMINYGGSRATGDNLKVVNTPVFRVDSPNNSVSSWRGIKFDDADVDYFENLSFYDQGTAWSYAFWVTFNTSVEQHVLALDAQDTGQNWLRMTGTIGTWSSRISNTFSGTLDTNDDTANQWYLVFFQCASDSVSIYINNNITATSFAAVCAGVDNNFRFGDDNRAGGGSNFDGMAGGLWVWNRSITQAERTNLYTGNFTEPVASDTTPPAVTIVSPANNNTNYTTQNILFNATISEATIGAVNFSFTNASGNDFNISVTNTSGSYSTTLSANQFTSGRHIMRVFATDTAGNIDANTTMNFTVDREAPNVTLNFLNLNNIYNGTNFSRSSNNQTFNVSVFDALVQLNNIYFWFDNGTGQDFNITGFNLSGEWFISYNVSALAEQKQGVRIMANDTLGNLNNSFVINFTVDFTPPNITLNSLNLNNVFNGSNFSFSTNNRTFNVSAFDSLTIVQNIYFWFDNGTGQDFNVTAINQSGDWTVSYNISALAEQKQGVRIIANDTLGNTNNSFVINFTTDFTSPNVTLSLVNGNVINASNFSMRSNNQTFNASIFDLLTGIDGVYFWFDNGTGQDFNVTPTNFSGDWTVSYNVSALAEQRQGVRIVANDTVSNVNSSFIINFTVDFTPPNVTAEFLNNVVNGSNFSIRSSNQTFNATIFDSLTQVGNVYFWFSNASGNDFNVSATNESGRWFISYNISILTEGKQGVAIVANDTVGNVNNTRFINFTIDLSAPTVSFNNPSDSAVISGTVVFNITTSDAFVEMSGVIFQFSNGSSPFNRTANNQSGYWNVTFDTSIIQEGALTVTAFANDTLGNMNSSQTLSLTVDNVAGGGGTTGGGGGGGVPTLKGNLTTSEEMVEQEFLEKPFLTRTGITIKSFIQKVLTPPEGRNEKIFYYTMFIIGFLLVLYLVYYFFNKNMEE